LSNYNTADAPYRVDALGQRCPMPLLLAKRALRDVPTGAVLEVLADDPGSTRDFAAFARLAGHRVVTESLPQGQLRHLITKA
jgi:TusA-related sulfurtransferase